MKTIALLAALAALSLTGCNTLKGVGADCAAAKGIADGLLAPTDKPIDPVLPLKPAETLGGVKVYRPALEK